MLVRRLVAAAALLVGAVAATVVVSSAPALAMSCDGTLVAVENGALGGGTSTSCSPSGGTARALFTAAGHTLRDASSAPGAVCTVDGLPADDPCVRMPPSDAYWGLFWTDGKTGRWVYSSLGVDSLSVPKGGGVDFVWQDSSTRVAPSVAAPLVVSKPTTTPTPATKPSTVPPPSGTHSVHVSVPAVGPVTFTPKPRSTPTRTPSPEPTRPSDVVGSATPPQASAGSIAPTGSQPGDHALPGWAAPLVAVVVVLGIAVVAGTRRWRRR